MAKEKERPTTTCDTEYQQNKQSVPYAFNVTLDNIQELVTRVSYICRTCTFYVAYSTSMQQIGCNIHATVT